MQLKTFVALAALSLAVPASATTNFDFLLDGTLSDGTVTSPIFAGGTFSTPDTLGVGDHALSSLNSYSFSLNVFVGGFESFTEADLLYPQFVTVRITNAGSGNQLRFGSDVAVVFQNTGGDIEFDSAFVNTFQFLPSSGSPFSGNYEATESAPPAIPEPASWAMLIAGFGMVGVAARRRNRVIAA